jgi:hypothetical protein
VECVSAAAPGEYDAPVHAVIGNAGQSLSPFTGVPPAWSLWRFAQFGFSTIEVDGPAGELTMSFFADCQRANNHEHPVTKQLPIDCSRADQLVHSFAIRRRVAP